MPRKAKEEIIEISKEVTEKKTPVKKQLKLLKKKVLKKQQLHHLRQQKQKK